MIYLTWAVIITLVVVAASFIVFGLRAITTSLLVEMNTTDNAKVVYKLGVKAIAMLTLAFLILLVVVLLAIGRI